MGVMIADYCLIRRQRIKLNDLYRTEPSDYWFQHGFNWRAVPCWVAGWGPTIGGLIVSAGGIDDAPDALFQLYYTAFFSGMAISFVSFFALNWCFPIKGAGEFDPYDDWATFSPHEAEKLGILPHENAEDFRAIKFGASGYSKPRTTVMSDKNLEGQLANPEPREPRIVNTKASS